MRKAVTPSKGCRRGFRREDPQGVEDGIASRKDQHIEASVSKLVEYGDALFDEVTLVHNALPELNLDEIDASVEIFGKRLSAPFIVGALTGGTALAAKVNERLAKSVESLGLGMYVGSQRIALERPETRWTFEVVKEYAPRALKIGNLGAPQLAKLDEKTLLDWALEAVDMIDADALAIHLNPLQEIFQAEGEPTFRGVLDKLRCLAKGLNKPIVVKEVGSGISKEVAGRLGEVVSAIDVGGRGGTSFVLIEGYRGARKWTDAFLDWGIPTVVSICEVRSAFGGTIIASGGVRSGVDGAKCIALGANAFSMSKPMLDAALENRVEEALERVIWELKAAMFLTGSRTVRELSTAPKVVGPRVRVWLESREIVC